MQRRSRLVERCHAVRPHLVTYYEAVNSYSLNLSCFFFFSNKIIGRKCLGGTHIEIRKFSKDIVIVFLQMRQ